MRFAAGSDQSGPHDWINHIRVTVLARGLEAHIIGAAEVARLNPLYDVEAAGVLAAVYAPDDGHVAPSGSCQAMAKGARHLGAKVRRNCCVLAIRQLPSGEWEVETEHGVIIAEHVVNAAGYRARQVGQMAGLDLPNTTMLHHYAVTDMVPEFEAMAHEIPITRDDYFSSYVRREQGSALIGLYDKQDQQTVWLDGCPWDSANELHVPNVRLGDLWAALWQAGQADGIGAFGSKALDSLRLEKFYRGGHEPANDASHKEVCQERFAATEKVFVGRDAMLAREPRSRIALLALEGEEAEALIGEAVFLGEQLAGSITSAAYGHAVGKSLAIAFLKDEARTPGPALTVSLLGRQIAATVLPDAPWDPQNAWLKA